jgi:hypothetical protein
MASSGTLRRVALVRADVSEECSASFVRVTGIGQLLKLSVTNNRRTLRKNTLVFLCSLRRLLATASVVTSSPILDTLMKKALSSFETSALTRPTWRNIPENAIRHSHRRENLKSQRDTIRFTVISLSKQSKLSVG